LGDYFSAQAAADEIGIDYKALLQRIARGRVEHQTFGRMKLVPAAEVKRLKQEEEHKRGQAA
jgi:hypothetical protein